MIKVQEDKLQAAIETFENVKIPGTEDDYAKGYNKAIDFALIVLKDYLFKDYFEYPLGRNDYQE